MEHFLCLFSSTLKKVLRAAWKIHLRAMVKELSCLHNSHLKMRHREKPKSTQSYVKRAENFIQAKASQCNAQYIEIPATTLFLHFVTKMCKSFGSTCDKRNCVRNILAVTLCPVTPVKYNFEQQK